MQRGEKRDANTGWRGRDIDMKREDLERKRRIREREGVEKGGSER